MALSNWPEDQPNYLNDVIDREADTWCEYRGYVLAETPKAVGIGASLLNAVDEWIPKSQLRGIEYDEGGDSTQVRLHEAIQAICLPQWLAKERGLL